jgi:hypothetical protein
MQGDPFLPLGEAFRDRFCQKIVVDLKAGTEAISVGRSPPRGILTLLNPTESSICRKITSHEMCFRLLKALQIV